MHCQYRLERSETNPLRDFCLDKCLVEFFISAQASRWRREEQISCLGQELIILMASVRGRSCFWMLVTDQREANIQVQSKANNFKLTKKGEWNMVKVDRKANACNQAYRARHMLQV